MGMNIDEFVLNSARVVAHQYRIVETKLRDIPHKLYRYEDVIFDKLAWANDMVAYLELSVRPTAIEMAVTENDLRPKVEDVNQHVRKVVPGDHAETLKSATVAELNARLAPIMRTYGYT